MHEYACLRLKGGIESYPRSRPTCTLLVTVRLYSSRISLEISSGRYHSALSVVFGVTSFAYSYPLEYVPKSATESEDASMETESKPRNQIISHENPSGGNLVLGHTSLLTSFLLTEDEQYIVSADRDEHIRVSWYPQGYVIERYCLGHKK